MASDLSKCRWSGKEECWPLAWIATSGNGDEFAYCARCLDAFNKVWPDWKVRPYDLPQPPQPTIDLDLELAAWRRKHIA